MHFRTKDLMDSQFQWAEGYNQSREIKIYVLYIAVITSLFEFPCPFS